VIDRLANVLYWAACLLAVALIGLGIFVMFSPYANADAKVVLPLFCGVGAIAIWLIGRAIRYVLSGR
jgi:hypothetical protein